MPKQKKKFDKKLKTGRGAAATNKSGDDNSEFNADENASTISNASTNMSYQNDLDSVEDSTIKVGKSTDEIVEKIDDYEEKIDKCLDGLLEKGFKEREAALNLLKKMFLSKYLIDMLDNKRYTLTDGLLKCLKRGKSNEQILACEVMMLTLIEIGILSEDVSSFLSDTKQILTEHMDDEKCDADVRAACAKVYALTVFINNDPSYDNVGVLNKLETIFALSYCKGDGSVRNFTPKVYDLHSSTLSSWSMLLCIMPLSYVTKATQKHLVHLTELLKSLDVDLRIAAGETIALLFELAQCDPQGDLKCFEDESLFDTLKALMNDSAKHRSKKEKKQQRASFRDILKTIEDGEFDSQTIKFGSEKLYIDNWVRRKQYDAFREILCTGMNVHLQQNEFIREMFDLGAPILASEASRRSVAAGMTRHQRTQFNKEQFRNKTKFMNKRREIKENQAGQTEED